MTIENLSRKHGLLLTTQDPDFLHCCEKCEVASSLGSIEVCPQRLHTSNSCCPSCGIFLTHGLESMLSHWKDQSTYLVGFQIIIPIAPVITEEIIRTAFRLEKVPIKQLSLLYEWKEGKTLDITFEKYLTWIMTIKRNYWPLNLNESFLRDPLVYGLAGFPARAGATIFSQLSTLVSDFKKWLTEHYQLDPEEFFNVNKESEQSISSYYVSYYMNFDNAENLEINIHAPDYERSNEPETCVINIGLDQIPTIQFQKVNETLIMQKGLISKWLTIEPTLQRMLKELTEITIEIRSTHTQKSTISELAGLLDRIQTIQEQFLKFKPSISNMQGHLSPIVPYLSEPLIGKLFPTFNLNLMNSWLDFSRSVERSVEGANSYIRGKMDLLALENEKKMTKRLNLLTAIFGCLSGLGLLVSFLSWANPNPSSSLLLLSGSLIISIIIITLIFVIRVISRN